MLRVAHEYPEDPTLLNDAPERSEYNCGGFALGTFDWYIPSGCDYFDPEGTVESILEDHPELRIIDSPDSVDPLVKVIGFRFGHDWCDEDWPDFHFLVRIDGDWYEKQGGWLILPFDRDPWDDWSNDDFAYDGEITWFVQDD